MLLFLTTLELAYLEPTETPSTEETSTTETLPTESSEKASEHVETEVIQESEETSTEEGNFEKEHEDKEKEKNTDGEVEDESAETEQEEVQVEITEEERRNNLYAQWQRIDEEAHYKQIQKFLQTGNYPSAHERLTFLTEFFDGYNTQFFWAFYYELTEDLDLAVELFEELHKNIEADEEKEDWKEELRIESLFRLGVLYDDLQKYDAAQNVFKEVRKEVRKNPVSKHLLQLLIGTSQIHQGKSWRGVRKISKSFPKIPTDEGTWIQSRTRNALVFELIRRSENFVFVGVNKKDRNAMIQKMRLLKDAEAQVVASIEIGEVEYVIKSLIQVIDGYTRLYDEVLATPAPRELTEDQQKEYKTKTKEQAIILLKTAHNYASKGVVFAQQAQWEGESYEQMQQREQALKKELE